MKQSRSHWLTQVSVIFYLGNNLTMLNYLYGIHSENLGGNKEVGTSQYLNLVLLGFDISSLS